MKNEKNIRNCLKKLNKIKTNEFPTPNLRVTSTHMQQKIINKQQSPVSQLKGNKNVIAIRHQKETEK